MFKIYYRVNPAPVSLNGTGCRVKVEDIMLIVYG